MKFSQPLQKKRTTYLPFRINRTKQSALRFKKNLTLLIRKGIICSLKKKQFITVVVITITIITIRGPYTVFLRLTALGIYPNIDFGWAALKWGRHSFQNWQERQRKNFHTKWFHLLENFMLKTGLLYFLNFLDEVLCDISYWLSAVN